MNYVGEVGELILPRTCCKLLTVFTATIYGSVLKRQPTLTTDPLNHIIEIHVITIRNRK
jgi:hypothetical protein